MAGRTPPFTKVLVANRGEIAVRVFRTLRELGIGTVAVYSDADRQSRHVRVADDAYRIGAGTPADSYLRGEAVLDAALKSGAEAVHPGYGFLAENAAFARMVEGAGLVWIGPPPAAIDAMGSKVEARRRMQAAGVPIIPGTTDPVDSLAELQELALELGFPLAIKASAGGGGRGLKLVHDQADLEAAFDSARREGQSYFGDATVFVERYIDDPRHVEVQVLADAHGNVIHLGERDCTIQRRHQKLVEETPSPAVDDELRARIGAIAVEAARAVDYRSAGTVEGLLTRSGEYFFLEMNTRIQVEHTVPELVTGLDLVREQVRIAAGERLGLRQEDVALRGHAIECRVNAEDVSSGFLPAPGRITAYREPGGPGVRVDSGVQEGDEISSLYDPMIAKLIVHDTSREAARRRMLRALEEFVIEGTPTLLGFHQALLEHPCFVAGETCHGIVESEELAQRAAELAAESRDLLSHQKTTVRTAPDGAPARSRLVAVEVDGRAYEVNVVTREPGWAALARKRRGRGAGLHGGAADTVVSPMQGTVLAVAVAEGDEVVAGQVVCVVEAMKMENEIVAHRDGIVRDLEVAVGDQIASGRPICHIGDA
jgi:acetyl-CoA/propionyl-CoA carboxylase biotin carboxyl carrier protein